MDSSKAYSWNPVSCFSSFEELNNQRKQMNKQDLSLCNATLRHNQEDVTTKISGLGYNINYSGER